MSRKPARGFLLVDKPRGLSSFKAVAPIKKYFKPSKVGFAGTLDPDATGLLLVGVGNATRLLQYIEPWNKTYTFDAIPGLVTDTRDTTGKTLEQKTVEPVPPEKIEKALRAFRGVIRQAPPVYSAIKVGGRRACDRVRRGEEVELEPREVRVFDFQLVHWEPQRWSFEVTCSKGTYVRSLVHDLGQALGVGAAAEAIRRTAIGPLSVSEALTPEAAADENQLRPLSLAVGDFPAVHLNATDEQKFIHGNALFWHAPELSPRSGLLADGARGEARDGLPEGRLFAVFDASERLLGMARGSHGRLEPQLVLMDTASASGREVSPD